MSEVVELHSGLTEHTFSAGAVKVNYAEGPDSGASLLLLHGLGRRWQVFLSLIPALSLRWHIFAADLRGHGRTSHVAHGYYGSEYADDVIRLMERAVPGPAVLFGHSLGGMIAMWIAAHRPELVRGLILGDNMIFHYEFGGTMYPALFAGLRDLARQGGSLEETAAGLAKIPLRVPGVRSPVIIGDMPGNDQAYLLSWARCLLQLDPEVFEMTLDGSSIRDWEPEQILTKIKCPTLLLQASPALGGLMSDEDVSAAHRLLPHCAHVKFETLGHALHIQQPEPVLRAVTKFLQSL